MWSREALATFLVVGGGGGGLLGCSHQRTCQERHDPSFGCYEAYYSAIVARRGVAAAFADLKAHYPTDPRVETLCHAITHHIGQAAFAKYSGIAEAFAHGDDFCASGYYHGVLQGFTSGAGRASLLANLDAVCSGVPGKERHSLEYYNCVHGLGHGIMAMRGESLFVALKDCDGLTGTVEQDACHNGVFMENLIVDGEHGGHFSRYLKPEDPLYPCTAVDRRHKTACFDIQTSYALGAVQGAFDKVFVLCSAVEAPFRYTCYQSLGRDAASVSLDRVPETVATCDLGATPEQRSYCIRGAALDFVYFYHSTAQAQQLCDAVDPGLRTDCRSTVGMIARRF
jgi:hypothetical protein